jgi:hypothetical protein
VTGFKELGDVIEKAARIRRVAACFLVDPSTAAVEERDEIAGLAQSRAGMLIPAAMTLDAMNTDDMRSGRCVCTR